MRSRNFRIYDGGRPAEVSTVNLPLRAEFHGSISHHRYEYKRRGSHLGSFVGLVAQEASQPEEAISLMLKVINNLSIEQSGKFVSQFGNQTMAVASHGC